MMDNLKTWLTWRLEDVVMDRRHDLAAIASGGAGYEEGLRKGQERTLRDCLDMIRQWEQQDGPDE